MRLRRLTLVVLCMVTTIGALTPAFAYDDWRGHERNEWRERQWRQHEWREHEWREHEWRQQYWPPALAVRPYGNYAPPPVFYHNPSYYR